MAKSKKFRKVARIEDRTTGKVVERIAFPKPNGVIGAIELPPSVIHDRRSFERHLRDVGAKLPRDRKVLSALLEQLANEKPEAFQVYAPRCGWTTDDRAYVQLQSVIGSPLEKIVGINPSTLANDASGRRFEAGTWREWRREVAKPAGQSSLLMCVIAFALAGPLLSFLGRDSRTLCLFGPSRSGKTTAVLVAASVIGIARTGDLPTWNLTDARLEQQLALFNDSLFPIDDLTGIGGKARDAYQRIHDLAYRLHQGWGRGRHSTFAANNNSAREQWRVIGLTSSETSIRDLAQAAGCERQAGESVRLIDVPVLINGEDRLFDRAKNVTSRNASAAIVRQIVEAVSRQHGSVSRRHVLNIIEAGGKLTAADDIKKFCVSVRAHGDGNLTRDVAETFGFAFAAGCFAIRCRLVPWTERELLDAITTIYTGARELLPDEGVLLRSGLKALRGLMRNIRREAGQTERKVDFEFTKGIRKSSGSSSRYLIKGDAFNSIFATAREKTLVTRWLLRKGRLTAAGPGKVGNDARARPKDQIVWPDGKRRRSVELTWPRRLKRRRAR